MWHEARRSEKKVHDMMDAARKRAQRRAVYLAKRRGDPQQSIQLVGFRCRTYRDDALYQATQDQQGLFVSFTLLFQYLDLYSITVSKASNRFNCILWLINLHKVDVVIFCISGYLGMGNRMYWLTGASLFFSYVYFIN